MSTIANRTAWATAKDGRRKTVIAANKALAALQAEGIIGYCYHTAPLSELVETGKMSRQLASDFPADYWIYYPLREPEEFDGTAWVKEKETECRQIATNIP